MVCCRNPVARVDFDTPLRKGAEGRTRAEFGSHMGVYPSPYSLLSFLTCEEAGPLTFPTPGVFCFFFKSRNSVPLSVDGRHVSWGVKELGRGMNVC